MSSLAERIFNSERPGYWAIQVRLEPATDLSRRYLCHAPNERDASAIAGRLMGSAVNTRGYNLSWIDESLLEAEGARLPVAGGYRTVPDPLEWAQFVALSARSEAAQQERMSS
jgi:hypothetical protein